MFAGLFGYLGTRFGFAHYGALSGFISVLAGAVALLVFPATAAVVRNAITFDAINVVLLVLNVVLLGYPVYLQLTGWRSRLLAHGDEEPSAQTPPAALKDDEVAAAPAAAVPMEAEEDDEEDNMATDGTASGSAAMVVVEPSEVMVA